MYFLPLTPRLQRLAKRMRWHHQNRRQEAVLCHLSNREAWKHFEKTYLDFAFKTQNVHLGLCSNGFSPYNLPLEMCMTTPYMFLTLIIPRQHNLKSRIDIQSLIDELKTWYNGILTYDISKK